MLHSFELLFLLSTGSVTDGFGGAGPGPLLEGVQKGACVLRPNPALTRILLTRPNVPSPLFFVYRSRLNLPRAPINLTAMISRECSPVAQRG
jgi:hypothetical protein